MDADQLNSFKNTVWSYYIANPRLMPWREDTRPYYILVSEFMLQQTQVARVLDKFAPFIDKFPDLQALAEAPLSEVIAQWSGLGYNRRAKYLKSSAEIILSRDAGQLPRELTELTSLPGIGTATASAILTYSYNICIPYIETNVRTVLLHHFYPNEENISDTQLMSLADLCWDAENPREWCWALMDYGTFLKKTVGNTNKQSKHYAKQSRFEGSDRQVRGRILKKLTVDNFSIPQLSAELGTKIDYTQKILEGLMRDGLVTEANGEYRLPE